MANTAVGRSIRSKRLEAKLTIFMNVKFLAGILLIFASLAQGESIDVLGQKVRLSNPSGYCTLGNSQRERDLLEVSQRSVGPGSRIVHAAIRCPELEAFRRGSRDDLDHWLQIQLIGLKGEFKRMEIGREAFLVGVAKASPRLNTVEINRRIEAALTDTGVSLSNMQATTLGRDGNAVYLSTRANLNVGGSSRPVTGLGGFTLVNSLPLLIIVYEGTGKTTSRENLRPTLQQLLNSVLTEN